MIRLQAGELACEIEPSLGGCIAGLWLGDAPVLRSTPAAQLISSRQAGSYPLVPFSDRIAGARLVWPGTAHSLVRNNGAEPHAIHGVGCRHPYFTNRRGSHISFEASAGWGTGPDKLPTGRRSHAGLDADGASLDTDHCFDGWRGVHLSGALLRVRVTSTLAKLVVFTNPARDSIAIEPVSHVNNAMNLVAAGCDPADLGPAIVQPGESCSAKLTIEVERTP